MNTSDGTPVPEKWKTEYRLSRSSQVKAIIEDLAHAEERILRLELFVRRIASIHDGKPHSKWIRGLGIEARQLLAKEPK